MSAVADRSLRPLDLKILDSERDAGGAVENDPDPAGTNRNGGMERALDLGARPDCREVGKSRAETAFRAAKAAIEEALGNESMTPEERTALERKRVELDQVFVD